MKYNYLIVGNMYFSEKNSILEARYFLAINLNNNIWLQIGTNTLELESTIGRPLYIDLPSWNKI